MIAVDANDKGLKLGYGGEQAFPTRIIGMKKFFVLCLFFIGLGWAISSFPGLATQGTYDSILLDFREDVGAVEIVKQVEAIANKYHVNPQLNSEFSQQDNVYVVKGDRSLLNALKKSNLAKDTEYIEPNYVYSAFEIPNDPMYNKQWNLRSINVESAWNETKGSGTTVAIIDTGISPVADLKETKFVPGYDFVNDRAEAFDDNGHGTHVAGTVAQSTNNNYGVAGIAYEAALMPLKVLGGSGGGTVSDIAEAIKFAADNGADNPREVKGEIDMVIHTRQDPFCLPMPCLCRRREDKGRMRVARS